MTRRQRYHGTARVNEQLRTVIAAELTRYDDERLFNVAITAVDCDAELGRAKVYFDTLDATDSSDEVALEGFEELKGRLRKTIATQTRLRRAPELVFAVDRGIREGAKIDAILERINQSGQTGQNDDEGID